MNGGTWNMLAARSRQGTRQNSPKMRLITMLRT
jgi:hypothetical protein